MKRGPVKVDQRCERVLEHRKLTIRVDRSALIEKVGGDLVGVEDDGVLASQIDSNDWPILDLPLSESEPVVLVQLEDIADLSWRVSGMMAHH
jgi:hypothetical protein